MLGDETIGGVTVQLAVEHSGSPYWLIVAKEQPGKRPELCTRILDDGDFARQAFDHCCLTFAMDHLRHVVGDDARLARLLYRLHQAEKDPEFIALVKAGDERKLEPELMKLFAESDLAVN